jgi:hypothetical protein
MSWSDHDRKEWLAATSHKAGAVTLVRFPLEQIVEAHRYAETGQKVGNIGVTFG